MLNQTIVTGSAKSPCSPGVAIRYLVRLRCDSCNRDPPVIEAGLRVRMNRSTVGFFPHAKCFKNGCATTYRGMPRAD
jgi:hypothetical protein